MATRLDLKSTSAKDLGLDEVLGAMMELPLKSYRINKTN
jgi:hypothetical protein